MSEDNGGGGNMTGFVVGALVGAAVGAGVALLLAPRNGKETRDWLTRKARELKDRTEGALEEAGEAVRRESRSLADRTSKDLAGVREMVR